MQLVDLDPARRTTAERLGVPFAVPGPAVSHGCDLVFHASASASGLELALVLAGVEATVVELSWYGAGAVPVGLGGAFHSQRLTLRASQVGMVAPERRARHHGGATWCSTRRPAPPGWSWRWRWPG